MLFRSHDSSCPTCGYFKGGEAKKDDSKPTPTPTPPLPIDKEKYDKFKKAFGYSEGGEVNLREDSEADKDEDDVILTNGQSNEFLDGIDDPSEPHNRAKAIMRKARMNRLINR